MEHMNLLDPIDGWRYFINICIVTMLRRLFIHIQLLCPMDTYTGTLPKFLQNFDTKPDPWKYVYVGQLRHESMWDTSHKSMSRIMNIPTIMSYEFSGIMLYSHCLGEYKLSLVYSYIKLSQLVALHEFAKRSFPFF